MEKTFAISKSLPDLSRFRHQWLHDAESGLYYIVHWPRLLREQLEFEKLSSMTHFPHPADHGTKMPSDIVKVMPSQAGVTERHTAYQALMRLHKHYGWDNFHPHG